MKIWLLAENWPPRRGGIENYLTHIAEQLGEMGHEVIVVAPSTRGENTEFRIKNVEVVRKRFFWPLVKPAWLPLFIFLWRRAKADRPDMILCGKALFEGLIGYYFKKHLAISYVVFTYAMEINSWHSKHGTSRKLRRVLGQADRVAHINEVTTKSLRELRVTDEQLIKILPGVDERFLRNITASLSEGTAKHFGITAPYVLSVGRLVPRKGFDTLIEAFSKLDQTKFARVKLVIVGEGPDKPRLEQIVADNYMQTTVKWLGAVDDKSLPALYAGAEFFALTPRDVDGDIEGFGIVYLEAAAVGKPALGTRTGGVAEAIVHEETGLLVDADDVSGVASGLARLLTDEPLRQRLGTQALARVRGNFQWQKRVEALESLFKGLA
jgi:phosphatidylinositol alpha-1,6-mannosyltransferase